MRKLLGTGLLAFVVATIAVSWLLAGDLYGGGADSLQTVADADRDHPLVVRAIDDAGLAVPDSAEDLAAQVDADEGFSAVAFTLPVADLSAFLTGSGLPTPFDEAPQLPPPLPALGWEPTDPAQLVGLSDRVDGRQRLVALDLADPEHPRVLVRSSAG